MAYWQDRQKQLNNQLEKDEKKLKEKLSKRYDVERKRLENEIAAYYQQYGENNVIEYRRLMQELSDADRQLLMERMDDFAAKYPQYAHLMPVRESIYKLNRLEGLQANIRMHQLEIGAVDQEELQAHLEKVALRSGNAAAEQMGFGKNFYTLSSDLVSKTISQQWADGKNFSERIWSNRQKLANYLNSDFAMAVARGDSYARCIKALGDRFGSVSRNDMYRLIYTEGTFVQNEAAITGFEEDFEQYKISIADSRACKICTALTDQVFDIKDRKPGVNFPPLHAWCRCSFTIEVADWDKWMDDYVVKHSKEPNDSVKSVANRADGGIIKEDKKKPITKISDSAIQRVPRIDISGYTKEQCDEIQRQHKELLEYARTYNDNKEVAFVFRKGLTDRVEFVGEDDRLDFGTGLMGKGDGLLVMHNHPRDSSYSLSDIIEFIGNDSMKTLTVVKNNGDVETLTKINGYDRLSFLRELQRLEKNGVKTGSDSEYRKIINKFLNKYQKEGVLEWRK